MKIYLILEYIVDPDSEYDEEKCRVHSVWVDLHSAQERVSNLEVQAKDSYITYHLITKTLKGFNKLKQNIEKDLIKGVITKHRINKIRERKEKYQRQLKKDKEKFKKAEEDMSYRYMKYGKF